MIALAAAGVLVWWFSAFVTDDALITLRYSRHLLDGHGLVWNPGEGPVEGYSNFLHVLIGAGSLGVGAPPLEVLRWLNRLAVPALVFTTWLYARKLCRRPGLADAAALLVALHVPLAFWASSGLETALFACCVTLGLYLALAAPRRWRPWAALAFGAAALARIEGPIFPLAAAATGAGAALWQERRPGPAARAFLREHASWLLLFGVPYLAYFGWRLWYFGYPLPNSVYFKAGSKLPGAMDLDFALHNAPLLLLALAAPYRRLGARAAALLLILGIQLAVFYDVKQSISYLQRFFLPVVPAAILLAMAGLDRALGTRPRRAAAGLAIVTLIGWSLLHPTIGVRGASAYLQPMNERLLLRVRVADWLSAHLDPEARILVTDVGTIGYLLPNPIDDAFGLNSVDFPHRFARKRGRYVRALAERSPDAIVVTSRYPDRYERVYVVDNHLRKLVLDAGYPRSEVVRNALAPFHYWIHVHRRSEHRRSEPLPLIVAEDAERMRVGALVERTRRGIAEREATR